jgi:CheY-like chemotaxis protein
VYRICVIDGSDADRRLIREGFNAHGLAHEMESFDTGQQFFEFAETSAGRTPCVPDLFILDVHLPSGDGVDVLQAVWLTLRDIPVIVHSNYVPPDVLAKICSAPNTRFVEKSSSPDDLLSIGKTAKEILEAERRSIPSR